MERKSWMITEQWLCYNDHVFLSVDFRLGATWVGLPRLRMPPTVNITIVAVVPYDFQLALIWDVSTPRDFGVILFSRRMI